MPNIQLLEKTLPSAPLRIAALESCLPLAQKADDYIVTFRKSALESMQSSALYANYKKDSYLLKTSAAFRLRGSKRNDQRICPRCRFICHGRCLQLQSDLLCQRTFKPHVPGRPLPGSETYHFRGYWKAHRINVIMPFLYRAASISVQRENLLTVHSDWKN